MKKTDHKDLAGSLLRVIPTKWAIAIVAILIGYVLLQPAFNRWFGWKLPSLGSLVDEDAVKPEKKAGSSTPTKGSQKSREIPSPAESEGEKEPAKQVEKKPDKELDKENGTEANKNVRTPIEPDKNTEKSARPSKASPQSAEEYLTKVGDRRFQSPAGLVYGPGSDEGHRLKHIERHLDDIPDRPGSHGVFDGTMVEFLTAIDDAFTRAKNGEKGTSKRSDDGSMIYEASFPKSIGFLGGQTGKRQKNPKLKRLRLVVRDKSIITAFPIQ